MRSGNSLRKCGCRTCDQYFEFRRGFNDTKKYCSRACQQREYRARHPKPRKQFDPNRYAYAGPCRHCGKDVWTPRPGQRLYCSDKCKQAAYRLRKEGAQVIIQGPPMPVINVPQPFLSIW